MSSSSPILALAVLLLAAALPALDAFEPRTDLAQALNSQGKQLAQDPPIHLYDEFLSAATVEHMLGMIPQGGSKAWAPCVGHVKEFGSKKCTFLPVAGDAVMEAAVDKIGTAWDVDVAMLKDKGLPVIRYLPGAPPVGLHGDKGEDGVVPTSTLVLYLTDAERDADGTVKGGQTLFPDAEPLDKDAGESVRVTPSRGSVLAFANVEADLQTPHPKARHSVGPVPADASGDRLVIQIPMLQHADGKFAYPEHVSGPEKQPGEHEALHGTPQQKAAYAAAIAAGASLTAAYAAALAGKWEGKKEEEKKE